MSGFGQFSRLGMFVVAAAVGLAACESTTEPAEPLTLEEAKALYLGMLAVFADTTPEIYPRPRTVGWSHVRWGDRSRWRLTSGRRWHPTPPV